MLFVLIEGEIMSQSNKLMYTTKSRAVVYEGLVGNESAWRIWEISEKQADSLSPVECHFLENIEKLHELEEKN